MSANKQGGRKANLISLTGKVVLKKFGAGSKSEHMALHLETDQGSYVLRRLGGNPFQDDSFDGLEGKTVTAKGRIDNYIFFATEVAEQD